MQVNPLIQIAEVIRALLGPFAYVPYSAITVLLISTLMALVTNLVNRRFIDYDKMRRARAEISKWQEMKREASKTTDERLKRKLLLKVKRRERYITKLQGEVGKSSFMPMLVTIIPFMLIYMVMNGVFVDPISYPVPVPGPVIISPLNFGQILGGFGMGFGWSNYGVSQYIGFNGVTIPLGSQGLFYIFWYILCSFFANMIFQRIFRTSMTG